MGKEAINKAESRLFDSRETLASLERIQEVDASELLSFGGRLEHEWFGWKDRFNTLSNKDKTEFQNHIRLRRRTDSAMNNHLKQMSGVAISEKEAVRLMRQLPTSGEGLFGGDAPYKFEQKLKDSIGELRLAIIRYGYARDHGLQFDNSVEHGFGISLNRDALLNLVGKDLEETYAKDGLAGKELESAVLRDLNVIFKGTQ
jgi:hypothetical protein